jgi:ABC-2 type transport system permease protein
MIALELKQTWRETGVQLVLAAFCLVLSGSIWQGGSLVKRTQEALAASVQHEHEFLSDIAKTSAALDAGTIERSSLRRDPHDVASFGSQQIVTYARLTPAPLAAVSAGQSALFPAYVPLTTGSRDKSMGSTEVANPESLQTGPIDAAFVLVYLLPLALIAIGYGIRANERETGVDVLIRTAAVRPWRVYARRLLLRAALLYAVVVAVLSISALVGVFSNPWRDLSLAFGLIAVYIAFWYSVVAAVALTAASGAISALRSISIWIVLLIIVPAAANVVARIVAPVPSRAEFVQSVRDATDGVEAQRATLLEKYLFDHPEMSGADSAANAVPAAIASLVTRRAVEAHASEVDARYQAQLNRQEAVIVRFEYFSPAIWLQNALNRLSGTDTGRYRAFLEGVSVYHEELRSFFETLLRAGASSNATPAAAGSPGDREHFHYPVFQDWTERLPVLGANSLLTLGLIVICTILLLTWTRRKLNGSPASITSR